MNGSRFDPYKNFKFRMKWDGRSVAAFTKASALKSTSEVADHRQGGDRTSSPPPPDPSQHEAVTLEGGVTRDPEFDSWANSVLSLPTGACEAAPPEDLRRDLVIEVYDEAGQRAIVYRVYGCWVSEYQAQPDLDANANAVRIQHLRLENKGSERDTP